MGGVRRRDAVVVARRSQPALENTPAWIHVSTVLGLGASWRGNALVRSRCLVCYSPLAQLFNLRLEPLCPLLLGKGRSHRVSSTPTANYRASSVAHAQPPAWRAVHASDRLLRGPRHHHRHDSVRQDERRVSRATGAAAAQRIAGAHHGSARRPSPARGGLRADAQTRRINQSRRQLDGVAARVSRRSIRSARPRVRREMKSSGARDAPIDVRTGSTGASCTRWRRAVMMLCPWRSRTRTRARC